MNCDIIKLLPDSVANQIAAGEVIQRPASVIKELVENSIDAGATSVEIIVKDAGRTLIQVVDNGKGMSPSDARMAFERHATSKITKADDLYALHTMGFRGEALPSIAAVAQIDMRTMTRDQSIGTRLQLSESQFVSQEACACTPGTNLSVKNLFFHMPARRKFLKKDNVEMSHILHEFERLALVNTNVDFTLINNGTTQYKLMRGNLKQRIIALMGKAIGSQIIPVSTETPMVSINGFVGLPGHARRRGAPQYFFVNGRNMRHPYFHKAVVSCYSELINADMQPIYFINLEVDPSTIDVNIHPQKHEIKFENEQAIWQILTAAIKQALGRINAAGAIDFDSEDTPEIPIFLPDSNATMPPIATDDSYNPFSDDPSSETHTTRASVETHHRTVDFSRPGVPRDWDKLYDNFNSRRTHSDNPLQSPEINSDTPEQPTPIPNIQSREDVLINVPEIHSSYITIKRKYIAMPMSNGLMIIDRYRAHVTVLFEKFMSSLATKNIDSQKLLFPESITLTPAQSTLMSSMADDLTRLGFDISFLGDCTWAINAVPAVKGHHVETLAKIASELADSGEYSPETLLRPAAIALARAAAIMPGDDLTDEETDTLIAQFLANDNAAYTPDGLRTFTIIDNDAIAKLFY